jgi:flavin-dependent dehydrogenase
MAADTVAGALERNDVSRASLARLETAWRNKFGADLRLAHRISRRIAQWDDRKWDERLEIVKLLSPAQFVQLLKSRLSGGWLWRLAASNPRAAAAGAKVLLRQPFSARPAAGRKRGADPESVSGR